MKFATCNVNRGLKYLSEYFSWWNINKKDVPTLVEMMEKDVIRVTDPDFHQDLHLLEGSNYDSSYKKQVEKAKQEVLGILNGGKLI